MYRSEGSLQRVDRAFAKLVREIQGFESTRMVAVDQDSHVAGAIEFIKRNQNADGSWGLGAMIDINLSLQSLGIWCPDDQSWKIRTGEAGGPELAFTWLDKTQSRGSWDRNIWDTAAVIQSASYHNQLHRPSIERALDWLAEQSASNWGEDHGVPPHYAAQALLAFIRSGTHAAHVNTLQRLLLRILENDFDRVARTLYFSGQVLEALTRSGVTPASEPVGRLLNSVRDVLAKTDVTIANFLDICAGFAGLGSAAGGIDPDDEVIQQTLANLYNPNRLRDDGSWYHDLTLTGWALVALQQVQEVRKIDVYPQSLYARIHLAATEVRGTVERVVAERRMTAAYSILFLTALVFTPLFLYLGIVGSMRIPDVSTELMLFLAPFGVTLGGVALRGLLHRLR